VSRLLSIETFRKSVKGLIASGKEAFHVHMFARTFIVVPRDGRDKKERSSNNLRERLRKSVNIYVLALQS